MVREKREERKEEVREEENLMERIGEKGEGGECTGKRNKRRRNAL